VEPEPPPVSGFDPLPPVSGFDPLPPVTGFDPLPVLPPDPEVPDPEVPDPEVPEPEVPEPEVSDPEVVPDPEVPEPEVPVPVPEPELPVTPLTAVPAGFVVPVWAEAAVAGTTRVAASSATARGRRARSMLLERRGADVVTATIRCMSGKFSARVSRRSLFIVILTFLLGSTLVAGCGDSSAPPAQAEGPAFVATALVPKVPIYDAPNSTKTQQTLKNPDSYGQPLTFLVLDQIDSWVQVALPVRPNGSSGWVKQEQVLLKPTPYRLDIALKAHELRLFKDGEVQQTYSIGVGKTETPTPGGTYYLRVLIKTTQPNGAYGPYAYGLNGFSQVLTDFAGGDGVIGLHGTNDPSSIGKDVSHGCIRLNNADITALAKILPLGTPVRILA
ncbi:MAG: hypothetical protein QOC80_2531, partial [Frankiaceae bacterium]|nr:hypothetical protein [Frankiaceae bacterium]